MDKNCFGQWTCDRLVKHGFDCLGLGLGLRIASGLWLGLVLGFM